MSEREGRPGELQFPDAGLEEDESPLAMGAVDPLVRHLLETAPAAMWATKPDGEPCYVNQRVVDYTGLTLRKLLDRGWTNSIHPEDEEKVGGAWAHAVRNGGSHEVRCRVLGADGRYRWFMIQAVPLLDGEGRVTRFLGMNRQLAFPPSCHEAQAAPAGSTKATGSDPMAPSGMRLSGRERSIVVMMGHGLSNKQIARQLGIAPETVKWYAKAIFCKLTVTTRAQAVYRASRLGLTA
jgi:PAS domain S-box-containing protein